MPFSSRRGAPSVSFFFFPQSPVSQSEKKPLGRVLVRLVIVRCGNRRSGGHFQILARKKKSCLVKKKIEG